MFPIFLADMTPKPRTLFRLMGEAIDCIRETGSERQDFSDQAEQLLRVSITGRLSFYYARSYACYYDKEIGGRCGGDLGLRLDQSTQVMASEVLPSLFDRVLQMEVS